METGARLRIGELSRRSGVSTDLLRAWERRYHLLRPERSAGGLRLYSAADLERVQTMQRHLAVGLSAAEAAALARQQPEPAVPGDFDARVRDLDAALAAFDEARAHEIIDGLLAAATIDTVLTSVVLPYLHELGSKWERGEASIAQEHFASALLRARLLALAKGWGLGIGPTAVLACAPGEHHDMALIAFGLALRARGWRIVYLGANTPLASLADAADRSSAELIVISAVRAEALDADAVHELATTRRVYIGGPAAADLAADDRVDTLQAGPVEEADRLTRLVARPV